MTVVPHAARALALGQWPSPNRPDPKDLGFDLHHAALILGVPVMFAVVLCVVVLTLLPRHEPGRQWQVAAAAVAGLAVVVVLASVDPGHLPIWLGD